MATEPPSPSAPPTTPFVSRPSPRGLASPGASVELAAGFASEDGPEDTPGERPASPFSPPRSPPPVAASSPQEGLGSLQTSGGSRPPLPLPSPNTLRAGGRGLGRRGAFHRQVATSAKEARGCKERRAIPCPVAPRLRVYLFAFSNQVSSPLSPVAVAAAAAAAAVLEKLPPPPVRETSE